MKVKTILVSQPEPQTDNSPYFDLAEKQKLKIDFRPFIHVAGVDVADVRKQKVNIPGHTAVIRTSRNAVDHFFRISEEIRFSVPNEMKYFCTSEAIAYYLQKYVVYRKRKIYFGNNTFQDLIPLIKKHKDEKFLLPSSDVLKPEIPKLLKDAKINYTRAILYNTVSSDLSDLSDVYYDILVFFSPSGIKSLMENFPDFKQNNTRIAAFGSSTHRAIKDAGLRLDIKAPTPKLPSMTMALEDYIKKVNKK
ncbi:MAG TPA: uroporphyrinogen-III synthase [Cryomorphaceae bacterium]|nr:uroporphyrinogen-III synthase [Cryomorphaceae bacterium]